MPPRPLALMLALLVSALTARAAAPLPSDYQLAALEAEQDKPFRTRSELAETLTRIHAEYADKDLAARGILDVTKAPYLARGDGRTDDTEALQRALRDARDARLIAWFPAGTYLVRDTLQGVQGIVEYRGGNRRTGENLRPGDYPCVIQGAPGPTRPVIKLAPDAKGFDDPNRPKPLLYVWVRRWTEPHDRQPNVSFNQVLLGVDFDVRGHAGAVAVDMQGAQGTVVQDVRIEAEGAFAGLRGLTGSGGSTHGLVVRGGRYGVLAAGLGANHFTGSQPAPLLAEATLHDQTEASIYWSGRGPLTLVGVNIRGAGIIARGTRQPYDGALNVIDSVLEIGGSTAISAADRPVFIHNTYVRGTREVVRLGDRPPLEAHASGWTHVREFGGAPDDRFPLWLDGKRETAPRHIVEAAAPPADLQSRHALPRLPAWNSAEVVDVKAPPYGAKGDDHTDDTAALQRAIDDNAIVYLPKGRYRLSRPLVLPAGKTIFGAGRAYTLLVANPDAPAFSDPAKPQPLVDTPDDAAANVVLARLALRPTGNGAYAMRWRAGGSHATVLDVSYHVRGYTAGPCVRIEGHGGGRWFNFENGLTTGRGQPGYRHLLVQGTRRPLTFYMFNVEHARSDANAEFVDVRNVTLYSLKGESHHIGNPESGSRPLLLVRDAENVRLFGAGGICGSRAGWPAFVYRFENCRDLLITNLAHQFSGLHFADPATWSFIVDRWDGREVATPGTESFVLYRR